jgi:hypothetical protein
VVITGCRRSGPATDYIADDYQNRELIVYNDLFVAWETILKFEVDGRDYGIDAESAEGAPRRHKS